MHFNGENMDFDELIKRVAKHLAMVNKSERRSGFAADEDCPVPVRLRTVELALNAGVKMEDWNCIAEAYLMLCAINKKINAKGN